MVSSSNYSFLLPTYFAPGCLCEGDDHENGDQSELHIVSQRDANCSSHLLYFTGNDNSQISWSIILFFCVDIVDTNDRLTPRVISASRPIADASESTFTDHCTTFAHRHSSTNQSHAVNLTIFDDTPIEPID